MVEGVQLKPSSHPALDEIIMLLDDNNAEGGFEPAMRAGFGEAENARLSVN